MDSHSCFHTMWIRIAAEAFLTRNTRNTSMVERHGFNGVYFGYSDQMSFELPKYNQIWDRDLTHQTLERHGLIYSGTVLFCKTGVVGNKGLPVSKQLRFVSNSGAFVLNLERKFGTCQCEEHSPMSEVTYSNTALYTPKLARGILHATRAGFKDDGVNR